MQNQHIKQWTPEDYSKAMSLAIHSNANERFLRIQDNRILFNGFWRNGQKQNVCAWLDKGTWHDAKTGDSGGCKEFAKVAFGLNLKEFMERFSSHNKAPNHSQDLGYHKDIKNKCRILNIDTIPVSPIWEKLVEAEPHKEDRASEWLEKERGLTNPLQWIGSGYVNIGLNDCNLFPERHRNFLKERIDKGALMAVPLRGTQSDQVKGMFLRTITSVPKGEKSRLLPGCGGWGTKDEGPFAFGFPHMIKEFPHLVLCEGMADYFAAEFLLDGSEKHLPLGAANADALRKWSKCIGDMGYKGEVSIVYQLDANENNEIANTAIGPKKALEAASILHDYGIKAHIFNWLGYLKNTTRKIEEVKDIADSVSNQHHHQECGEGHLQYMFRLFLTYKSNAQG